ncbi:MAG: enoyl-CoA hydratase/isomerase family protein [Ilumatobacteraceae bacterium]
MSVSTVVDFGTPDLQVTIDDLGVMVARLNRPDRRNAFSAAMGGALSELYQRADVDDRIRVVVLTGTPPAFCAGADLSSGSEVFERRTESSFRACPVEPTAWQIRKPVIAAVNGHAIGIGLTLALHCDIRVMALEAKYGVVQVRRGVMPDAYSHWTLPRLVGLATAADMLLTGRVFDGSEALRLGLASRAVANDQVLDTALELARDIAVNTAPLSVAFTKRLLWESFSSSAANIGEAETALHQLLMGSVDAREGVTAYLERRKPQWNLSPVSDWPNAWPNDSAGDASTPR